jgi:TRAP-type uncharacterized transport system substrate-binding protein
MAQPAPGRAGVAVPTLVAGYDTYLAASTALTDADANDITRTLIDAWGSLTQDYPALRAVTTADLLVPGTEIPFHAGALRAYDERGLRPSAP